MEFNRRLCGSKDPFEVVSILNCQLRAEDFTHDEQSLWKKPGAIRKRLVFAIRNTDLNVSPVPRIPEKLELHPGRESKLLSLFVRL